MIKDTDELADGRDPYVRRGAELPWEHTALPAPVVAHLEGLQTPHCRDLSGGFLP